jgi:hypothetical protein
MMNATISALRKMTSPQNYASVEPAKYDLT